MVAKKAVAKKASKKRKKVVKTARAEHTSTGAIDFIREFAPEAGKVGAGAVIGAAATLGAVSLQNNNNNNGGVEETTHRSTDAQRLVSLGIVTVMGAGLTTYFAVRKRKLQRAWRDQARAPLRSTDNHPHSTDDEPEWLREAGRQVRMS